LKPLCDASESPQVTYSGPAIEDKKHRSFLQFVRHVLENTMTCSPGFLEGKSSGVFLPILTKTIPPGNPRFMNSKELRIDRERLSVEEGRGSFPGPAAWVCHGRLRVKESVA